MKWFTKPKTLMLNLKNAPIIQRSLDESICSNAANIFSQFLKQQFTKKRDVLHAKYSYSMDLVDENNKKITIFIRLSHTLTYGFKQIGNRRKSFFHVLLPFTNELERINRSGAHAQFRDILGIFFFQDNKLFFKNMPHWGMKIMNISDDDSQIYAEIEASLSERCTHLHAKKMLLEKNAWNMYVLAYMRLRKFKGLALSTILENDKNKSRVLSTDERFTLSINLLRALDEQIHAKGVVHRDIKPKNIIVDLDTFTINIIDLGLGRALERVDHMFPGTLVYVAQEVITQEYELDERSDTASMAIVIGELWHAQNERSNPIYSEATVVNKIFLNHNLDVFKRIFYGIADLTLDAKQQIKYCLQKMYTRNIDKRISLQIAIKIFENLKLTHYCERHIKAQEQIKLGYFLANKANFELKKLMQTASSDTSFSTLKKIKEIIFAAMDKIDGASSFGYNQFIETINVNAIKQLKSPVEVKKFTIEIIKHFKNNLITLFNLFEKVEVYLIFSSTELRQIKIINDFHELYEDIEFFYKKQNIEIKLDDLLTFNKKAEKHIAMFSARLSQLENDFFADPILKPLANHVALMKNITWGEEADDLDQFKNKIIKSINDYLKSTLTIKNLIKQDRAASVRRIKDIEQILKVLTKQDKQEIINDLLGKLSVIKTGFFDRSRLRHNVQKVLDEEVMDSKSTFRIQNVL